MKLVPDFLYRRIEHRPALVKIVDNIGWLFLDKFLRMVVGLYISVWVARYLGPERFGLFSFCVAFVGLFSSFAGLGLPVVVVRDIVRRSSSLSATMGTAFGLHFAGGLLAYAAILYCAFWMRPEDTETQCLIVILGSVLLFKFSDIAVCWFESQVLSKYVVWVQTAIFFLFAIAKVFLILGNKPLIAFVWLSAAEGILAAFSVLVMLGLKAQFTERLRFSLIRAKEMLLDSWPLMLSGMVLMVQARVDQIMLGQLLDVEEVAQYSVALRLVEALAIGSVVLKSTFAPSIISAKQGTAENYRRKLAMFYKLNMLVAILIVVPVATFSGPIIHLLFGTDYSASAPILALMSLRLVFSYAGTPRAVYLLNENLLTYSAVTMILGTLVNVILNYLWIPSFGGMGATLASLISFAVTIFIIDLIFSKTRSNAMLMLHSIFSFGTLLRRRTWAL